MICETILYSHHLRCSFFIKNRKGTVINLNMSIPTLRMTEDLIVAILLGDSFIQNKSGKHELKFYLPLNKRKILKMYIEKYQLQHLVFIEEMIDEKDTYLVKDSLVLERIIRAWSDGTNIIAMDPRLLRNSTYMLWLCLFGTKVNNQVLIKQNTLTLDTKHTLIYLFEKTMRTSYLRLNAEGHLKVQALDELLLTSIIENRPSYESLELHALLTDHAKKTFLQKQERMNEEMRGYACY